MRILVCFILFSIVGCSSTQRNKTIHKNNLEGIVYVLPGNVQELLLKQSLNEKSYFILSKIDELSFRIYVEKFDEKSNWIRNTNRYAAISGNLYPLLFDFDNFFANRETSKEFLENYEKGIYERTKVTVTRDFVYHIDFNIQGDILYEGL